MVIEDRERDNFLGSGCLMEGQSETGSSDGITTRGERSHRTTSDVRLPIQSGSERSGLLLMTLENDSPGETEITKMAKWRRGFVTGDKEGNENPTEFQLREASNRLGK